MAEVQVKVFRVKFVDWNGVDRVQTQMPQNWSPRHFGPLNAENLQKFLKAQWPENVVFQSVEEVSAVVEAEKFKLPAMPTGLSADTAAARLAQIPATRLTPDTAPKVIEKP